MDTHTDPTTRRAAWIHQVDRIARQLDRTTDALYLANIARGRGQHSELAHRQRRCAGFADTCYSALAGDKVAQALTVQLSDQRY